jgi:hypothetical protein
MKKTGFIALGEPRPFCFCVEKNAKKSPRPTKLCNRQKKDSAESFLTLNVLSSGRPRLKFRNSHLGSDELPTAAFELVMRENTSSQKSHASS